MEIPVSKYRQLSPGEAATGWRKQCREAIDDYIAKVCEDPTMRVTDDMMTIMGNMEQELLSVPEGWEPRPLYRKWFNDKLIGAKDRPRRPREQQGNF